MSKFTNNMHELILQIANKAEQHYTFYPQLVYYNDLINILMNQKCRPLMFYFASHHKRFYFLFYYLIIDDKSDGDNYAKLHCYDRAFTKYLNNMKFDNDNNESSLQRNIALVLFVKIILPWHAWPFYPALKCMICNQEIEYSFIRANFNQLRYGIIACTECSQKTQETLKNVLISSTDQAKCRACRGNNDMFFSLCLLHNVKCLLCRNKLENSIQNNCVTCSSCTNNEINQMYENALAVRKMQRDYKKFKSSQFHLDNKCLFKYCLIHNSLK